MALLDNPIIQKIWYTMVRTCPKTSCRILYRHILHKKLNLNHPHDLNEKIQWLKFHVDLDVWARLADKYVVREYVKEKGLENILIPLLGKYNSSSDLLADWGKLPKQFVIKTNNGCGTVKIVHDKNTINLAELKKTLDSWLAMKHIGLGTIEFHYLRIKPCLIIEEMLEEDNSMSDYSCSMIDYKIWCFNGKPYCCVAIYNRRKATDYVFDMYDLSWKCMREMILGSESMRYNGYLPEPKNWNKMLEIASILCEGHPEVRCDLYNVNGKIYFGEMTMTARGGYQNHYTQEMLDKMGSQISLNDLL